MTAAKEPQVKAFFDAPTNTISYLVTLSHSRTSSL